MYCVNQRSERVRDHPEIMIWTVQCWHQTIYHLNILDLLAASDLRWLILNILSRIFKYFYGKYSYLVLVNSSLSYCKYYSYYSYYQQFFGSFCNNSGIDCFKRTWIIISKSFIVHQQVGRSGPRLYFCTDRDWILSITFLWNKHRCLLYLLNKVKARSSKREERCSLICPRSSYLGLWSVALQHRCLPSLSLPGLSSLSSLLSRAD